MAYPLSRRGFVLAATVTGLASSRPGSKAYGANEKITIGFIGAGSRGYYLMERLYRAAAGEVQVLAVCDTYSGWLARGVERIQKLFGNTPKPFVDYQDLLAERDLDAVFIATPEHLHHRQTMDAIRARKHIYLEKPIAHTIEEGAEIVKAAQNYDRVIQVGTQNRSNPLYQKAKEMVESGMIGNVYYVRAFWYRNFPSGTTPAPWRYVIPEDASEKTCDWNRFLGPARKRPFDKRRYFQWRNYWDYSGGISTDLLVHQTDIANFVLGKSVPIMCMATGGILAWGAPNDDREVPDTLSAIYKYAEPFHLNYSCFFANDHYGYGEQFLGYEGTIEVLNRSELHFYPQRFGGKPPERVAARKELHIKEPMDNLSVENHIRNWLDSIRGKAKPIAPATEGQIAAIPGHMATLSYQRGKAIEWNPTTQKYRFV